MLLAAWLLGEREEGEWLISSILACFSGYHSPRAKAVTSQAPDEVEVTAWRTAADRLTIPPTLCVYLPWAISDLLPFSTAAAYLMAQSSQCGLTCCSRKNMYANVAALLGTENRKTVVLLDAGLHG